MDVRAAVATQAGKPLEIMTVQAEYVSLLVEHHPAKPRKRRELKEMTSLLETLAMNETRQTRAMERFIETLTALVMQYEDEIEPDPDGLSAGDRAGVGGARDDVVRDIDTARAPDP